MVQREPAPQLVQFRWPVPSSGYRWTLPRELKKGSREPWLVPSGGEPGGRFAQPLRDNPSLFLTFSELGAGELEILTFANRHGWLGDNEDVPLADLSPMAGQRRGSWIRAIANMRAACGLLNAIENRDVSTLKNWIEIEPIGGPFSTYGIAFTRDFSELGFRRPYWFRIIGRHPESALLRKGDFARCGRVVLQKLVNDQLETHTSARLLFDENAERQGLHVTPGNLLGALWIQLAQSIDSGATRRRCQKCGSWMLLSLSTNRSDRAFCSDGCRMSAYRDRIKEASRLHERGMAPSAIARKLRSDTGTVRGWLGLRK